MYLAMKTLHVLAAVLFLGNIITGLFWKAHGDRTGDPRIIAHTLDGIIRSDRWFTIPSVLLILVSGFGAAGMAHLPVLRTPWIGLGALLFTLSGAAFVVQIAPLQVRLREMAAAAAAGGVWSPAEYHALSRRWELWGIFAILTPLAALVLMVFKPTF